MPHAALSSGAEGRTAVKRRRLLLMAAACSAGLIACSGPATAQPSHKVSAQQLQQVLSRRFPLRYAVGGALELRIEAPRLLLLPKQNRVGSELAIDASGEALRRSYTGHVALDFALRYEPSDMTVRAHQIRINAVRIPGLDPNTAALIDAYARASAERALLEVVLHTLRPHDLALAHTMGLEPGAITVTADGLVIGFVPREAR